jgi:hypothetical protein
MENNKVKKLVEKYKLSNIIKVILLLIVLFLVYRIFIESSNKNIYKSIYNNNNYNYNNNNFKNIYEGFTATLGNTIYGNIISLYDQQNIPVYSKNTCIFKLSDVFRIDTLIFNFNTSQNFTISFTDGNGNIKNIKGDSSTGSPPVFSGMSNNIQSIQDENNLIVYTSQIILTLIDKTIILDDTKLTSFGIYGGDKNLPSFDTYNTLSNTLEYSESSFALQPTSSSPANNILNTYNFNQSNDTMIYALKLNLSGNGLQITKPTLTEAPFNIIVTYENSLYYKNIFTIKNKYIIRNDYNIVNDDKSTLFIFLTEPIIANKITFTIQKIATKSAPSQSIMINVTNLKVLDKTPSNTEISDYKQSVNLITSSQNDSSNNTNICPSINELVDTQNKTQQICDNMEYQDKIKSEKLRLERNKQYLLKLKDQQDQIEQLNTAIQSLEDKRQARALVSDQARVLQYQKQKEDSSTIRDLANQRLESQANNQLYMNVSVNN